MAKYTDEQIKQALEHCIPEVIRWAKAEAIKEFAERLKSEMYTVGFDIDNLVKEMVVRENDYTRNKHE